MKLNWGTGIAIFYSLFVFAMIGAVVKSCHSETHLVQENYYAHDLAYEQFRQARANAKSLQESVKIDILEDQLQVQFPSIMQDIEGEIQLFRPANKYQDKIWPITLDKENQVVLELDQGPRSRGKWLLKINWEHADKPYYHEEILVL